MLFGMVGLSYGDGPVQEWIYVVIDSESFNGGEPYIMIMTKQGGVTFSAELDLATVTYDFTGVVDRGRFDLLKECFGLDTITPSQIGSIFGTHAIVAYAYAYNIGPQIVHTYQDFADALSSHRIGQNVVTVRLVY